MSDNKEKKKILTDKLKYLYKMELSQRKFQVNEIDIEYEEMQNTDEEWILDRVNISVSCEYDGRLDGYDPQSFINDLETMFNKFRDAIIQYTPTQEYRIVRGDDDCYVETPMLFKFNYQFEDTHALELSIFITYPE